MIEMLVTLGVSGITLASAVHFFSTHAHHLRQHSFRLEAQQAMRASLDAITRDLRLAGACLPSDGQFVALGGVNAAGGDSVTVRTGLVRTNMSCIVTSLAAVVNAGNDTFTVQNANGFTSDMLVYVRHPNGSGEIHPTIAVGGNAITVGAGLSQQFPAGSGVYAVDERVYALDESDPNLPVLTLTVNRDAPQAFAAGMTDLQVRYVLNQGCPACAEVDLPIDTAEWRLVNSVILTATVETVGGVRPEDETTLVASSTAKPRNLLP